jgi:hypothetical protein
MQQFVGLVSVPAFTLGTLGHPASLYHLTTDVFALAHLWRVGEPMGFFNSLLLK